MDELKTFRKANGLSQLDLAKYLGVSQGFVSQIETGISDMPDWCIKKISMNISWDSSSLISLIETNDLPEINYGDMEKYMVRVLPISARCGSLMDYSQAVRPEDCEWGVSPIAGADFIVPVYGESMAPEIANGSMAVVKKIDGNAFIEWGRIYLLDTVNGPVIKEIRKSEQEDTLTCVSLNPDPKYAPFQVRCSDIFGIYRVMMVMSMK